MQFMSEFGEKLGKFFSIFVLVFLSNADDKIPYVD